MILTSNRGFAEWGEVFGDLVSLPHPSIGYFTTPSSFRSRIRDCRLRQHADLVPDHIRSNRT